MQVLETESMNILRAAHLGMCFGVKDAIQLAQETASTRGRVTLLGEIVHNPSVLADLRGRGVETAANAATPPEGPVMITAHGVSNRAKAALQPLGDRVIDGTCPLVAHAHRTILQLARDGYYPVVIGVQNHVEVRGLTGDLEAFSVVLAEEDLSRIPERPKIGVIAQTTQPLVRVIALVEAIRRRFSTAEVIFRDTVCQPTKQRQRAVTDLAHRCDVVVVVGGLHSNNTRELAATCEQAGVRAVRVQNTSELREEWFENVGTVGLTAGTSTPDGDIEAVEGWLRRLAERQCPVDSKRARCEFALSPDSASFLLGRAADSF